MIFDSCCSNRHNTKIMKEIKALSVYKRKSTKRYSEVVPCYTGRGQQACKRDHLQAARLGSEFHDRI